MPCSNAIIFSFANMEITISLGMGITISLGMGIIKISGSM